MNTPKSAAVLVAALALAVLACSRPSDKPVGGLVGRKPKPAPAATPAPSPPPPPAPSSAPVEESAYPLHPTSAFSDDPAIRKVIDGLTDSGRSKAAADILLQDKATALPLLRRLLRHEARNVRIQAAQILAFEGTVAPATTAVFREALRDDPDQEVRAFLARLLRTYDDDGLTADLIACLADDPYETARANAAWALGELRRKAAVPALIAALADSESWVRLRSISALRRLNATQAIPALVERVRDENDVVRKRAIETLERLTRKRHGESYEAWLKVAKQYK